MLSGTVGCRSWSVLGEAAVVVVTVVAVAVVVEKDCCWLLNNGLFMLYICCICCNCCCVTGDSVETPVAGCGDVGELSEEVDLFLSSP